MIETDNATIEGVDLFIEDHGVLTFYISLDYGNSSHQGFGGYYLATEDKSSAFAGRILFDILHTLEVDHWDDLKGKVVRAKHEHSKVHAIGHPTKNKWVDVQKIADKYAGEKEWK